MTFLIFYRMRTSNFVVLNLLLVVTFSGAAAIKATSGLPLKWEDSHLRGQTASPESSPINPEEFHSPEVGHHSEGDPWGESLISKNEIVEKIRSASVSEKPEIATTEEDVEGLEEAKRALRGIMQEKVWESKSRCAFVPVSQVDHRSLDLPDSLNTHLDDIKAKQFISKESSESISYAPRLPAGCYRMLSVDEGKSIITCSGPNLTSIPEFRVRMINQLYFHNTGILKVTHDQIVNLPRTLNSLVFTDGILTFFDGRTLKYIDDLTMLSLKDNFVTGWSFAMVFQDDNNPNYTHSLKHLDLQNNYLSYPPDPMGSDPVNMPYLETIGLNHNPLCYLPEKLFKPLKNSPIKRLYMKNCSLCDFNGNPLSFLPHLEVLDLSANTGMDVSKVTKFLKPLKHGQLRVLYLAQNNYASVPKTALALVNATLEKLDLHAAAFTSLDNTSFPLMPKLKILNLMYSRIYSIDENTFETLPILEELYLDGNYLHSFPAAVLLPSLRKLSMIENPTYTGGDASRAFNMGNVNLSKMKNLRSLSLDKVQLKVIKNTYFLGLYELQNLSLVECHISSIEPYSFRNLTKLKTLSLGNNDLSLMANETFWGLTSLKTLSLDRNRIAFFSRDIIIPKKMGVANSKAETQETETLEDTWQRSRPLSRARVFEDMVTFWKNQVTFTEGQRSTLHGEDSTVHGTLREDGGREPTAYLPFDGLKNLKSLSLAYNQIRCLVPEIFRDLVSLHVLNLADNQIDQWYVPILQHSPSLSVLSLEKNSIKALTEAVVKDFQIESLEMVNLNHNELLCNCSLTFFNDSLNTSIFVDFPSYVCVKDNKYYNLSEAIQEIDCPDEAPSTGDDDTEATILEMQVIIGIILTLPLVVLFASLIIYKRRWYIRYIMYSMKSGIKMYKEDDSNYLYDTFVCYSQTDRQWVFEHLVNKLEQAAKYRVCVHERDFAVGQEITENIIYSVEKSRKCPPTPPTSPYPFPRPQAPTGAHRLLLTAFPSSHFRLSYPLRSTLISMRNEVTEDSD
ncbi:LOW QUALITY PROTEIN: toll-like receptor 13 [Palaemon carinicauda]|uniref:LOW QUALITY PROTEIN: toll-like receptor 13 n=1 Tax=Palaemon carinicauda TaxID=392227 RepID=UPI0035B5C171